MTIIRLFGIGLVAFMMLGCSGGSSSNGESVIVGTPPVAFSLNAIADSTIGENSSYASPALTSSGVIVGTLNFTIVGSDASKFTINSSTGIVTMGAKDFENPTDVNSDNVYEVGITAKDDANKTSTITWTVTVEDVNESISMTIDVISNASISENDATYTVTPTLSGDTPIGGVTYALSGSDAGSFSIDASTGVVTMSAKDFENPSDADGDNIYEVGIVATDADANMASQDWNVTITNIVETANFTLTTIPDAAIPSGEAYSNTASTSGGTPIGVVSYVLSGADAGDFSVSSSGEVSMSPKDYSTPEDYDTDNIYEVNLTATDSDGNSASTSIAWNVTVLPNIKQPLLVVRVQFTGESFDNDAATWSSKIFGNSKGELNHYYNEISKGKFQFEEANETDGVADGLVTVTLNIPRPLDDNGGSYPMLTALKSALETSDTYVDFATYDTNNDSTISADELQIMFLVAGGERSTGYPLAEGVWAHAWCIHSGNIGTAPVIDGVKLMECASGGGYSRFGEKHFKNSPQDATVGIIAHELGHAALNLPDLYDTDGSDGTTGGIGYFGLMGSGSWGQESGERPGATPVHMTAWSKIKSGFVSAVVVDSNQTITLNATSTNSYQPYQINTDVVGEYFLLENRFIGGYDKGLAELDGFTSSFKGGLSVLHIDDSQTTNGINMMRLVDVVEASNAQLDNTSGTNRGHVNNLFYAELNDTLPINETKLNNAINSNIEINNISTAGTTMTADVIVP